MSVVAAVARVAVAVVLVWAAVSKLRTRERTRVQTIALLGRSAGAPVATALPFVELALAIALLAWWSPVPGIVAAVLFVAFVAVVVRAQLLRLPCACLGGASDTPAGPAALLRTALLVAGAVLATGSPR